MSPKMEKWGNNLKGVLPIAGLFVSLALGSGLTHAAKHKVTGGVTDIVISNSTFGNCAIAVEGFAAPGACGNKWISLDCSGDFMEKSIARSMLEVAQIASATGKDVTAYVDDAKRHNGRCVAYQIILR